MKKHAPKAPTIAPPAPAAPVASKPVPPARTAAKGRMISRLGAYAHPKKKGGR